MRAADAPRAGWYPDPENATRLRWWDGLDWTDIRRAPPSDIELLRQEQQSLDVQSIQESIQSSATAQRTMARTDSQQIITEVRQAARDEVNRAADLFSQRTQAAVRSVTPLVTEYSNRLIRWIKFAAVVATVLLVAWFVFQVVAQASFFEWLGDRIDELFDDEQGAAVAPAPPLHP